MRIGVLAWRDLAHPQAGGSEYVVDELSKGLTQRGHEVILLAGSPSSTHRYESHALGGTYSQYLAAPFVWHRDVEHADVIIDVENGIPFFSPLWTRTPVVCLVHHVHTEQWGMQFRAPIASIGRFLESKVMPRVYRRSRFVSVSSSTTASLAGLGIPRERITTIEMGTAPLAATDAVPDDEPRFVILGRLVPHKRVDLALRVWPEVRAATGGRLIVVGDGPEMSMLRDLATDGVEFTGSVDEDQKATHLATSWLLVHPAHHEGWGTVVMEAASMGVPTVGFDVEGVRDSVEHAVTGLLAADERQFVANWIELATNDSLRSRMSDAARARSATFGWSRAIDEFERVLLDSNSN